MPNAYLSAYVSPANNTFGLPLLYEWSIVSGSASFANPQDRYSPALNLDVTTFPVKVRLTVDTYPVAPNRRIITYLTLSGGNSIVSDQARGSYQVGDFATFEVEKADDLPFDDCEETDLVFVWEMWDGSVYTTDIPRLTKRVNIGALPVSFVTGDRTRKAAYSVTVYAPNGDFQRLAAEEVFNVPPIPSSVSVTNNGLPVPYTTELNVGVPDGAPAYLAPESSNYRFKILHVNQAGYWRGRRIFQLKNRVTGKWHTVLNDAGSIAVLPPDDEVDAGYKTSAYLYQEYNTELRFSSIGDPTFSDAIPELDPYAAPYSYRVDIEVISGATDSISGNPVVDGTYLRILKAGTDLTATYVSGTKLLLGESPAQASSVPIEVVSSHYWDIGDGSRTYLSVTPTPAASSKDHLFRSTFPVSKYRFTSDLELLEVFDGDPNTYSATWRPLEVLSGAIQLGTQVVDTDFKQDSPDPVVQNDTAGGKRYVVRQSAESGSYELIIQDQDTGVWYAPWIEGGCITLEKVEPPVAYVEYSWYVGGVKQAGEDDPTLNLLVTNVGDFEVVARLDDNYGGVLEIPFTIVGLRNVAPQVSPILTAPRLPLREGVGQAALFTVYAQDPEGDHGGLTFTWELVDTILSLETSDLNVNATVTSDFTAYSVARLPIDTSLGTLFPLGVEQASINMKCTVEDASGNQQEVSLSVPIEKNQAPVIDSITTDVTEVPEAGGSVNYAAEVTDANADDFVYEWTFTLPRPAVMRGRSVNYFTLPQDKELSSVIVGSLKVIDTYKAESAVEDVPVVRIL